MAKQTFTTGQVLTAAEMTSLQNTAMGGGAASTKTANYVLVAADAGTTVAMNAAGATTITVNTGLFAAGDTVFIQNIGAGVCTITAGTATVNTAGALALPQYDAGILYFTSASAAIFYDYIQVGAASPLTTKGDLYTFSTSDTRLGVGANGTVLTAASGEATGLQWATPASGGMTSLATGTLSTGTVTLSAIDQTYNDLSLRIYKPSTTSASGTVYFRVNGVTSASYKYTFLDTSTTTVNGDIGKTSLDLVVAGTAVTNTYIQLDFPGYSLVSGQTVGKAFDFLNAIEASGKSQFGQCFVDTATAQAPITSITIFTAAGTFDAGTYTLWGIK